MCVGGRWVCGVCVWGRVSCGKVTTWLSARFGLWKELERQVLFPPTIEFISISLSLKKAFNTPSPNT